MKKHAQDNPPPESAHALAAANDANASLKKQVEGLVIIVQELKVQLSNLDSAGGNSATADAGQEDKENRRPKKRKQEHNFVWTDGLIYNKT